PDAAQAHRGPARGGARPLRRLVHARHHHGRGPVPHEREGGGGGLLWPRPLRVLRLERAGGEHDPAPGGRAAEARLVRAGRARQGAGPAGRRRPPGAGGRAGRALRAPMPRHPRRVLPRSGGHRPHAARRVVHGGGRGHRGRGRLLLHLRPQARHDHLGGRQHLPGGDRGRAAPPSQGAGRGGVRGAGRRVGRAGARGPAGASGRDAVPRGDRGVLPPAHGRLQGAARGLVPRALPPRRGGQAAEAPAARALLGRPRDPGVRVPALRARLTTKITLVIVLVLVVGFGVSTILTLQRESALLVEQNKTAARRLIMTLVASIETAMLSERPDITRGLIEDLRGSRLVSGLTVYRRNGVEAFTDLATLREVSKEAELPQGVMASIQRRRREPGRTMAGPLFTRAVETLQAQEALESHDGSTVFTLYQPIPNQERCQGCHGTDHKVRAVVQVATSMEPVMAEVR